MSRSLPAALSTELSAKELKPFQALELEFSDETVRFWTGFGDLLANDETWSGIGQVLSISPTDESNDLSAKGMNFVLSGLDTNVISAVLNENYRLRPCAVYVGALDENDRPVSDLYQVFSGRIDVIRIEEDGESANVIINAESRLIDLNRARVRKYTDAEQKQRYPGDNSLAQVALLQDKTITWGSQDG